MAVQVTPFRGSQPLRTAALGNQIRNQREGLALREAALDQRGRELEANRALRERELAQDQATAQQARRDEIMSAIPKAIEQARALAASAPEGRRVALFGSVINPILSRARESGIDVSQYEAALANPEESDFAPEVDPKRADSLRKEYRKASSQFSDQAASFGRIQASADNPSAAGDLALIFNYMKLLDPGSAVRETEFANAQNAAGVPERIRAQWNNLLRGERLTDETRGDFLNRAERLFMKAREGQQLRVENFTRLAEREGIDPSAVVVNLDPIGQFEMTPQPPQSPAPVPTATGPNGEKVQLVNGQWVPVNG